MLGERVPDTKAFYQRRIMRIVPSYYFLTLLMLVVVAIPYNLYGRTSEAVRDVLMHLTFTQTFNYATYIATPIGVASWTIAIEMQAYLIFPLLAKGAMKNPLGTLMSMAAVAFAFRGWCLWRLDEYNMVVNQLANFLDVYAMGMGASILYVRLTQLYPAESRKKWLWQSAATLVFCVSLYGMLRVIRAQAYTSGQAAMQAAQMMRRPLLLSPADSRHTSPPLPHPPVWRSDSRTGCVFWSLLNLTYLSISPFGFLRQGSHLIDDPSH